MTYLLTGEILSSVIQIIIFALIPFIWWLITARRQSAFLKWLGFKWNKREIDGRILIWILCAIAGFWIVGELSLYALKDIATATTEFSGKGMKALPAIVMYAVFHTALSEEILFRGFLLKRISSKLGFYAGNTIQAILFGLLHGIMLVSDAGYFKSALLILFTAAVAWGMGYINERKAGGSVFPGWIIHGSTNIISGICSAFLIG